MRQSGKMSGELVSRARNALILLTFVTYASSDFTVPDVTIKVLKPKGLEASIPDSPGITFFVFNGNKNRGIANNSLGLFNGEVLHATNGRWVYTNTDAELNAGDVINYYVFVAHNQIGYLKDSQKYTVPEDAVPGVKEPVDVTSETSPVTKCKQSITSIRGGKACSGQVIFEDHFNDLRADVWQVEQYIPLAHPEYPFVSYQATLPNGAVSVSGGYLRIEPKLQQTMPGFNNDSIIMGSLDLFSGCTAGADSCFRDASGPDILPPVVSGRLTSSSFAFTYGTVYIKAKLPQGDWIYPDLLLEPFLRKYGRSNYASGVIKIASARGNRQLLASRYSLDDLGNKVLFGGPIMDFDCRNELLSSKKIPSGLWSDAFHEYSINWTPEAITLSVDGEEWARVDANRPLLSLIPDRCERLPRTLLEKGTYLAPFDDYFYLTLGVSVGGISEFPDNTVSNGKDKPWRNAARKAILNFWQDLNSWRTTWTQPELLVDYVRVVAL